MTAQDHTYTAEQAEEDIAALRGQVDLMGEFISTGQLIAIPDDPGDSVTPAANFTVSSFIHREVAGLQWVEVNLSYTGATITASAVGNIADTACCTLPVAPVTTIYLAWLKGGVADGGMSIDSSGVATLLSLSPGATLASGDPVHFYAIFPTQ